jgi:hypothetical protein
MTVREIKDNVNINIATENTKYYKHYYMNINIDKLESNVRLVNTKFDTPEIPDTKPIFNKMFEELELEPEHEDK